MTTGALVIVIVTQSRMTTGALVIVIVTQSRMTTGALVIVSGLGCTNLN
jgi:hypothetical protein